MRPASLVAGLVTLVAMVPDAGLASLPSYGVLKATVIETQVVQGSASHFQIYARAAGKSYRLAFNVGGRQSQQQRIVILRDFKHPITDRLSKLEDGWHPVTPESRQGLDYLRGDFFHFTQTQFYALERLVGELKDLSTRASAHPKARVYAFGQQWGPEAARDKIFGFTPSRGVHDLHYNQGNAAPFTEDDGVWQDGGMLFWLPDEGKWTAVFAMFTTQSLSTDNVTGHAVQSAFSTLPGFKPDTSDNPTSPSRSSTRSKTEPARPDAGRPAGNPSGLGLLVSARFATMLVVTLSLAAIVVALWLSKRTHDRRRSSAPASAAASPPVSSATEGSGASPPPAQAARERFDVFLCHNSADKPEVQAICNRLRHGGLNPWLDKEQLRPGLRWQEALESQIGSIGSAAVFVGGSGLGPWQTRELRAFIDEFVRRDCPLIPVLLPSAPSAPELPIFLRQVTYVDFRTDPDEALERLLWGITGRKPVATD